MGLANLTYLDFYVAREGGSVIPMYNWICTSCSEWVEKVVPYDQRDDEYDHECGSRLERRPAGAKSGAGNYQMKAVITDNHERVVGHVPGHFGKEAMRKRK